MAYLLTDVFRIPNLAGIHTTVKTRRLPGASGQIQTFHVVRTHPVYQAEFDRAIGSIRFRNRLRVKRGGIG